MNEQTHRFMSWLRVYDTAKHDELTQARAVEHVGDGFQFNGKAVRVTDTALKQLCAGCGIPTDFFRYTLTPDEQTAIFNRLNGEQAEAERLYRFHGSTLYGVVSPRYKKIDNIRILDVLQSAEDSGIGLKPVRWTLSHDHTRVTLVPDIARVGELTPSITITNSENGLASLTMWSGVYRWKCTNGLMVPVSGVTKTRWMHIGTNDIRLPDIGVVLNLSREYTERLYESRSRYLGADEKSGIVVDISRALGQKTAEKVVEIANREYNGGRTLFDTVNAITRAAQAFRPAEQSEIERYAGALLRAA